MLLVCIDQREGVRENAKNDWCHPLKCFCQH
jgi:hypothetical protein